MLFLYVLSFKPQLRRCFTPSGSTALMTLMTESLQYSDTQQLILAELVAYDKQTIITNTLR